MSVLNFQYFLLFFLGLVHYAHCYEYSLAGLVISALFAFILFCCMVATILALFLWRNWYHNYKTRKGFKRVPRIYKVKTFKQKSLSETVLVEKPMGEHQFISTVPGTMRSVKTVSTVPVRPIVTYPPSVISSRAVPLKRKNQTGSWIVEIPDGHVDGTAGTMNFEEEDNEPTKFRSTVISSETSHPEFSATKKQEFTSSHPIHTTNADDMEVIFDPAEDDTSVKGRPIMPLY
ncbi:hypothetical protein CHS0354_005916 [Potamilus streckersoni]|uniref:Uncharacterized protein n=1 Tax=Potamilus streckersoni TaxID=2493646 RepID=A0AAE0T264_9BIVA|nr:hypothetical protein CHS0354_005916 [Potamilus streckersoni]